MNCLRKATFHNAKTRRELIKKIWEVDPLNFPRCGIKEILGQVLSENIPMMRVCNALGFTSKRDLDDPGVVIVSLKL